MPELKLEDGTVVTGTAEELVEILAKMGAAKRGMYFSKSKGVLMDIEGMNKAHVRNALLVIYREWAAQLSGLHDMSLIEALRNGPADNPTFVNLLTAYVEKMEEK